MDMLISYLMVLSKHTAVDFGYQGRVKGKREREREKEMDLKGGERKKRKKEKESTSCGSSTIQLERPGTWGTHMEKVHWAFWGYLCIDNFSLPRK